MWKFLLYVMSLIINSLFFFSSYTLIYGMTVSKDSSSELKDGVWLLWFWLGRLLRDFCKDLMSFVILCDTVVFIFTLGILMLLPTFVLLAVEVVLMVLMVDCLNKVFRCTISILNICYFSFLKKKFCFSWMIIFIGSFACLIRLCVCSSI